MSPYARAGSHWGSQELSESFEGDRKKGHKYDVFTTCAAPPSEKKWGLFMHGFGGGNA